MTPLLTLKVHETPRAAAGAGLPAVECSLDLERSTMTVELGSAEWSWQGRRFPYLEACKARTIYHWAEGTFQPVARFSLSLIKLVPTEWGPPTFEIDGIKMLPTERVSPYGLRGSNPWSPGTGGALALTQGDITEEIAGLPGGSVDTILHDPPRFGIAGELYSQAFYNQLGRVLKRKGKLFHYTGTPNRLSSGRDTRAEVANRLRQAGFGMQLTGASVLVANGGA
jgi:hypothetical protein